MSQFLSLLLDFLIRNNLSFRLIRSPELKELLEQISARRIMMPSRNTIMSHLSSKFLLMKNNLKSELSKYSEVCLTTDIWTHRSRSFIGVSCHCIDHEWKRKSFILAFRRMAKRHTYDNLAISLIQIIEEYSLDCKKNNTHSY